MNLAEQIPTWPARLQRFWARWHKLEARHAKRSPAAAESAEAPAAAAPIRSPRGLWLLSLFLRINGWRLRKTDIGLRWVKRNAAGEIRYCLLHSGALSVELSRVPAPQPPPSPAS